MVKVCLLIALSTVATWPSRICAQVVDNPRSHTTSDVLDSLKAGRKRWASTNVREYQIQSHVGCFCVYTLEQMREQLPLLTIRNGAIIARGKGKPNMPPSPALTVEGLFAEVERDAQTIGRIIDRLDLHPIYGFPVRYEARYPPIPDEWVQLRVDSFAVLKKR